MSGTLINGLENLINLGHNHYQCVFPIWEQSIRCLLSYQAHTIYMVDGRQWAASTWNHQCSHTCTMDTCTTDSFHRASCTMDTCKTGWLYNWTSVQWALEERTFVYPGTYKSRHLNNQTGINRTLVQKPSMKANEPKFGSILMSLPQLGFIYRLLGHCVQWSVQ